MNCPIQVMLLLVVVVVVIMMMLMMMTMILVGNRYSKISIQFDGYAFSNLPFVSQPLKKIPVWNIF